MAKILFTAIVADMRNKLNGTVFSKNRYGAYARTKVTPVNPQSTDQTTVRSRFGNRSASWRGLTDAQRQSWIDGASGFPVFDIFGNSKILSGQALYNRLNLNLSQIGAAAITTCPVAVAIPQHAVTAIAAEVGGAQIVVDFSPTPVPAGFALVTTATPLYGAGISFVKNKFRFIQSSAAATATGIDIIGNWGTKFGALVAGQKMSVKQFLVSTTTGQAGVPSSLSTTVVA